MGMVMVQGAYRLPCMTLKRTLAFCTHFCILHRRVRAGGPQLGIAIQLIGKTPVCRRMEIFELPLEYDFAAWLPVKWSKRALFCSTVSDDGDQRDFKECFIIGQDPVTNHARRQHPRLMQWPY